MVAEDDHRLLFEIFLEISMFLPGEGIPEGFVPDPLDLVLGIAEIGHVVHPVAGIDALFATPGALPGVDHHGPSFGHQFFWTSGKPGSFISSQGRFDSHSNERQPRVFQKAPAAAIHRLPPFGTTWQSQQLGLTPE
jgi:hypothetical protein